MSLKYRYVRKNIIAYDYAYLLKSKVYMEVQKDNTLIIYICPKPISNSFMLYISKNMSFNLTEMTYDKSFNYATIYRFCFYGTGKPFKKIPYGCTLHMVHITDFRL